MSKMLVGGAWYRRVTAVAAAAATVAALSMTFAVSDARAHGDCTAKAQVLHHNIGGPLGTTNVGGYGVADCGERHDAMEICAKLQWQPAPGLDSWTTVAEDCHYATNPPDGLTGLNVFVWAPCRAGSWRTVADGYATSSTGGDHSLAAVAPEELRIC